MVSVISEKRLTESGASALATSRPKCKRRRVSAVRDFPPGCGPKAPQINQVANEVPVHGDNIVTTEACLVHPGCGPNALQTSQVANDVLVHHHDNIETNGESAVHEFPPGCGTNASQINQVPNEIPVDGSINTNGASEGRKFQLSAVGEFPPGCRPNDPQIGGVTIEMADRSDNIQTNGHIGIESSEMEADKNLKSINEPETDDLPACSSVVKKVASVSAKVENDDVINAGHIGQQFLKESDTLESKEVVLETPEPSDHLQKTMVNSASEELMPLMCGLSSDLGEVKVQLQGTSKAVDRLGSRDGAGVIVEAKEVIGDSIIGSHLLPYHPILSTTVRMEKKYPPRRRFSAVRDFPPGCGPNAQLVGSNAESSRAFTSCEDTLVVRDKANASNIDNMVQTGVEVIDQQVHSLDSHGRGMKPAVPGNTVHELEARSKSDDQVNAREHHVRTQGIIGYSRKAKNSMGGVRNEVEGDVIVYMKKKIEKVAVASDAHSKSPSLRKNMVNRDVVMDKEIVLGLMAEPHFESSKVRRNVQSSPSNPSAIQINLSAIQSKRKKRVSSNQDVAKLKDHRINSVGSMSPSTEIDDYPSARQLVRWKDGSPVNNEQHDEFQLVHRSCDVDVNLLPFGASSSTDKGARTKVRETLRLFQAIVRKLMQEEETKPKVKGNPTKRVDLLASAILKDKGKYINNDKKVVGSVPGVEIGDEFHYRVELMMIGLHRQMQGGIDFVKQGGKVIATSIVASGGYDNVVDNSDILIYTGQGGNATGGDKQPEDQKLERGNLSLVNSMHEKNFVRVTRGSKEPNGKGKLISTYTYDGLYLVEDYWPESGPHGKTVYKFKLRRCPGQQELVWKELKKSTKSKVREGCCVDDISGGKERIPICAVNTIDDEKPPPFTYITGMRYPDWCCPIPPKGCSCVGGCTDSEKCACAVKNGGEIPFNHDGAIVEAKSLVYECGPLCKCPSTCYNRVSQHGIQFKLEIFKTESRGWGVRSLSSIPSGSFICEYVGELLDDKEAEERTGNDEYLFDIGQNYNDHALWEGLSTLMPDMPSTSSGLVENVGFTIDALQYGNVGRFINHSCSPNLYAQNVLYNHEDRRIPHIMFFAAENIPPLQELTYHYNYTIDQVRDPDGNIKKKSCYCGSSECTGRMY